jgi:catechol 2,3-dioxygenase-like lactoylglutathione lyase family enzyme
MSRDQKLEVVVLPVSDVDRSKRFYESLGWRVDADFRNGDDFRAVQMTPPGSPCSVHFGKGITTMAPGSVQSVYLVVSDIEAARQDLARGGAEVGETFHYTSIGGAVRPGRDPEGRSYNTYATFRDPDGNGFLLQEVTTRLPGRGVSNLDIATLVGFLKEAETRHGEYEATKPPRHHWSDWYAAYIVARENGKTPEDAVKEGALHMKGAPR